jgi:AcrR family transcriptional regulator/uncharacterized protein YndB with AHSA1/START domain
MSPPKRAPRKPSRPYHHGNLRRALLDEAIATIRTDGVDAVTLREIGARVGVSRTALYRHFADKGALLSAVATEGFRTLRQALVAAWEDGGRDGHAFRAMGVAYVGFAVANPSHYRVMFGGPVDPREPDPELVTEGQAAFQALVDALVALQRDGLMRPGDDSALMATHVWALVHGIAMLSLDGKLRKPGLVDALMQYSLDRLWTGIAANPIRSTRVHRHIRAPRVEVYRLLLDPAAIVKWRVPDGMSARIHSFDAREGGELRVSLTYDAPVGTGKTTRHTDTYRGRFVRLVPNEQVVEVDEFETTDPALRGAMTSIFTLADAADGGTDIVGVHEDVPPGVSLADNETGWRMALDKLAALAEASRTSRG